jgi:hypothetical protein
MPSSFHDYVTRMLHLDELIRTEATGSPQELASRLQVSERALYDQLQYMRKTLSCPIVYCRDRQSYCYAHPGKLMLAFLSEGQVRRLEAAFDWPS